MEIESGSKLEKTAWNLFTQNVSLYDPLQIVSYETAKSRINSTKYVPDAYLTFSWKGKKFKFDVEVTGNLYLEAKLAKLKQVTPNYDEILIIVPYISKGISELVKKEGVCCLDLSGNYYIQRDDLLAIRLDQPDQFKAFSRIKKLYSGNSSQVGRFLLKGGEEYPPSLQGLQRAIKSRNGDLAQSTISKVLSEMELDQIILKEPGGLKLLQARKLLDRLREQYRPPDITNVLKIKCPCDPVEWLNKQIALPWVRTGEASASRYAVTTPNQMMSVYVPIMPLELPIDERFFNLILNVTSDTFVYLDCEAYDKNRWASQIQTYLELSQMDKREKEIAETIKNTILSQYE